MTGLAELGRVRLDDVECRIEHVGGWHNSRRTRCRPCPESYLLSVRCAKSVTIRIQGEIADSSTLEPESRIELLTYSSRVISHSTLC